MALSIEELKDIRTTIEWLLKNTQLVENNRTNLETLYNTTANNLNSIDRAIGELSDENSGLHKHFVNARIPDKEEIERVCTEYMDSIIKETDYRDRPIYLKYAFKAGVNYLNEFLDGR